MTIGFPAIIYKTGSVYTGWLKDIKGVIAQGSSIAEVMEELMQVLQIKNEIERQRMKGHECEENMFHEELTLQIPA